MLTIVLTLALATLTLVSSQYPEDSPQYEQQQAQGEHLLTQQLKSHPDIVDDYFPDKQAATAYDAYRTSIPPREDYVIGLLVNPCGSNGTHGGIGGNALGYDCCMDRFGRGEYGYLKSNEAGAGPDGEPVLRGLHVSPSHTLAGPDEVLHNMILVDEDGAEIPKKYSRRADDDTIIDDTCRGLRDPHPSCLGDRLRAVKSRLMSPCSDNNQTVDATLDCYTPDGKRSRNCMQIGFSQTAFIHVCSGEFASDDRCGTFVEVHRQNGSPYDDEDVPLAETKITKRVTNGMSTTTIPLTYKGDTSRIMCAFQETKIRVGSMVRITKDSPECCCPGPAYSAAIRNAGSFFCPKAPRTRNGPFAGIPRSFKERVESERHGSEYPFCPLMPINEDLFMCINGVGAKSDGARELSEYNFSDPCEAATEDGDGSYGSKELEGKYDDLCPLGGTFKACALASTSQSERCIGSDSRFSFQGEIAKVVEVPAGPKGTFGVSFNDGRTVYFFEEHELELQIVDNTYELWFVQRNRFEKIIKKRKSFRVLWPRCSFDVVNDRYVPFAQLDDNGDPMPTVL